MDAGPGPCAGADAALWDALGIGEADLRANAEGRLGPGQRRRMAALADRADRSSRAGVTAGLVLLAVAVVAGIAAWGLGTGGQVMRSAAGVAAVLGVVLVSSRPFQRRAARALGALAGAPVAPVEGEARCSTTNYRQFGRQYLVEVGPQVFVVERPVHAAFRDGCRYRAYGVSHRGSRLLVGAQAIPSPPRPPAGARRPPPPA